MTRTIRAAIFDVGGVITSSPVQSIRGFETDCDLPEGSLGPLLASHDGAWSLFEKSELAIPDFVVAFEKECEAAGFSVDGTAFLGAFFGGLVVREDMVGAVRELRRHMKVGCITNNVARDDDSPSPVALAELFDVVIESSKVGLRKPDPRIYQLACRELEAEPEEAVFLDDFGVNLKAARALGMVTIKVDETDSGLRELERVVGLSLRPPSRSPS